MTKSAIWVLLAGFTVVGASSASAAPVGPSSPVTASEAKGTTQVHKRCYRHRGHWHCPRYTRYYRYRYYDGPYYGYYSRPYYYSYGPSFGIYFGGRRGWHGHWW